MKPTTTWITRRAWLLCGVLLAFGALSLAWGAQENFNSFMIIDSTGTNRVTVTGTALDVNCTGCSSASTVAVSHIASALHIAGTIKGAAFHMQGLGIPGQAHGGVLTIQGVAGAVPVAISGSITAGDAVNVFHQSTIRHVSSTTHIAGSLQIQDMTCTTCRARVDHYNVLVVQPHISGAFRAWRVASCGTSATQMVATNTNRRDLYIQNLGGPTVSAGAHSNVYLGFGTTGHVALTINNGWVLHSMSRSITPVTTSDTARVMSGDTAQLILYNYQGPVSCIAATTGPLGATLTILEILR